VFCSSLEFLQRFVVRPLLGRQLTRELHVDGRVQVAVFVGFADRGHSVAFQPEDLSVLRPGRNPQTERLATERRNLRFASEHGRGERDCDARIKVLSLALELRVRRQADPQIQIARLRAGSPVLLNADVAGRLEALARGPLGERAGEMARAAGDTRDALEGKITGTNLRRGPANALLAFDVLMDALGAPA